MANRYSMTENTKEKSQKRAIADIFENAIGKSLPKREVEKLYGFKVALESLDNSKSYTKSEIIELSNYLPGDLQRDIRIFYDTFKDYGLSKDGTGKNITYTWNPIEKSDTSTIVRTAARNIFKTEEDVAQFKKERDDKCEMCGEKHSRMAVDHWRAHSIYNIDDPRIAVLLCEPCNNIHHNLDAVKIASKYKNNVQILKRWVNKEKLIRSYGFEPNEADSKQQNEIIHLLVDHHKDLNPLAESFWEGLYTY